MTTSARPLLTAVLVTALAGCSAPEPVVWKVQGEALGTTWMVRWVEMPSAKVDRVEVEQAAKDALESVDKGMSTWRDDSELQTIRSAQGPVVVSEQTFQVTRAALDLAHATGGAFDPTVQPLMELWGLHGEKRTDLPSADQVDATLRQIGWWKVLLSRSEQGKPMVDSGATALDLSAIAKGHAVDRISHGVSALGIADHFVEVGGEVRVAGHGPTGERWRVGVDWPEPGGAPGARLAAILAVSNLSVATSGNYRNAYEVDGKTVVHTLDPRVGRPVENTVASVTVVAPDCRTADGWATALMVLGPDEGLPLIEAQSDVEALVLTFADDGLQPASSSGLSSFQVPLDPVTTP